METQAESPQSPKNKCGGPPAQERHGACSGGSERAASASAGAGQGDILKTVRQEEEVSQCDGGRCVSRSVKAHDVQTTLNVSRAH